MTTSPMPSLSKPVHAEKVPEATFSYMRARFRHRIHSLILSEFAESDLSQADLARRLGKKPELVCRWLAAPVNLRLSTLSDILFAINGGELVDNVQHPLEQPPHNDTLPDWLAEAVDASVERAERPIIDLGLRSNPISTSPGSDMVLVESPRRP